MTSGKHTRAPASGIPVVAGIQSANAAHSPSHARRDRLNWWLVAAVGAGSIVAAGTGTALILSTSQQDEFTITTKRPVEIIRFGSLRSKSDSLIGNLGAGRSKQDSVTVPPPLGTINRMNAIRGAFSK